MDLSSYMQLKCGQCGKHLVVPVPGNNIEDVRCDACQHEINVRVFTKGANFDTLGSMVHFDTDEVQYADLAKKALRERLVVTCEHCSSRLRMSKRLSGQEVTCAVCNKSFTVPILYDDAEFDRYLNPAAAAAAQLSGKITSIAQQSMRRAKLKEKNSRKQLISIAIAVVLTVILVVVGLTYFKKLASGDNDLASDNTPQIAQNGLDNQKNPTQPSNNSGTEDNNQNSGNNIAGDNTNNLGNNNAGSNTDDNTATARPGNQNNQSNSSGNVVLKNSSVKWLYSIGNKVAPQPGNLFVALKVKLKAKNNKVWLNNAGESVFLDINGKVFNSLGAPATDYILPIVAIKKRLEILPNVETEAEFLFEVPARSFVGSIKIPEINTQINVNMKIDDSIPPMIEGYFVETGPRKIAPFSQEASLKAFKNVPVQKMVIKKLAGNKIRVSLPEIKLTFQCKPTSSWGEYIGLANISKFMFVKLCMQLDNSKCTLYFGKNFQNQVSFTRKDEPSSKDNQTGTKKSGVKLKEVLVPEDNNSDKGIDKTKDIRDIFFGDKKK